MNTSVCLGAAMLVVAVAAGSAQSQPLTVERLKALKTSSNDPAGDAFVDSRERLMPLIDAFVADNSLASPMFLYFAANTAFRLGRVEDAAFLFYGAQLRRAVDFQRYNIDTTANGNNAATYLGFLNQTTGVAINPAIMRLPAAFTSVIARLERWDVVASRRAFYPEFAEAKGFRVPEAEWPALARRTKQGFMDQFGKRMVTLLGDKQYFEAFSFVQRVNLGEIGKDDKNEQDRFLKSVEIMEAAERRLLGTPADAPAPPVTASPPPAAKPSASVKSGTMPVRVGGDVKDPQVVSRVEPAFPPGAKGAVILEVTIDPTGAVADVRVLRSEPALDAAAVAAVRQWRFDPTVIDGKPVSVLKTISLSAR